MLMKTRKNGSASGVLGKAVGQGHPRRSSRLQQPRTGNMKSNLFRPTHVVPAVDERPQAGSHQAAVHRDHAASVVRVLDGVAAWLPVADNAVRRRVNG